MSPFAEQPDAIVYCGRPAIDSPPLVVFSVHGPDAHEAAQAWCDEHNQTDYVAFRSAAEAALRQTEARIAELRADRSTRLAELAFDTMLKAARERLARFDDYLTWSHADGSFWTSPLASYGSDDLPTIVSLEGI